MIKAEEPSTSPTGSIDIELQVVAANGSTEESSEDSEPQPPDAALGSTIPKLDRFHRWAQCVVDELSIDASVTIRIVDEDEIQQLNSQYRNKNQTTNVLSFPMELPDFIELNPKPLGEIVICRQVIAREAKIQNKLPEHHWAHMVIHGLLHLLGYDHIVDIDAQVMETLETRLLAQIGIPDPYLVGE